VLHVGDRVVGIGGQWDAIAQAGGECLKLAPSTPMRIGAAIPVPVMRIVLPGQSAARSSSD
jgi:hypothetical protein